MATGVASPLRSAQLAGLRLAVPQTLVLDDLAPEVAAAFDDALKRLSQAGIRVDSAPFSEWAEIPVMNAKGGLSAAESYAWHRPLLAEKRALYDPRVAVRILRGAELSAVDYLDLLSWRRRLTDATAKSAAPFDAMVMPTVAMTPPKLSDFVSDATYLRLTLLAARNPSVVNLVDGCAITLPIHREGEAPVGLMLAGMAGADERLFAIAAAIEPLFCDS
jgi:aspartyl-tRNA(Asn)/glutamyl-tRNA(Gln) amidotransferase subunit A